MCAISQGCCYTVSVAHVHCLLRASFSTAEPRLPTVLLLTPSYVRYCTPCHWKLSIQSMKCTLVTPPPTLFHLLGQLSRHSARLPRRHLHPSPSSSANPLPVTQPGPPPTAPLPAASQYGERVHRRRQQAELIRKGQEIRTNQSKPGSALRKRFWKDVSVQTSPGMIPLFTPKYQTGFPNTTSAPS